jgi:membrane fusion protein, multidrug efflux system
MPGRWFHMKRTGAMLAAVIVAACGGSDGDAQTAQAGAQTGRGGAGGMGGAARVAVVEVQPVTRGNIARQVTVSGIVEPVRSVGVNSQLSGAVNVVAVQEGDVVRRGSVLARMDARELVAQLASAEAQYEVTKAAYERAEQLRERRVITLPEYERERTAFAAAQAQMDQLRTRVGYATVTAPVAGVITEKQVESGDVVGTQARLFTIADMSEVVTRVGVSELDVVELSQGDGVSITLDAFPNQTLRGRIRRIFPSGDPTTRLVLVEVVFDAQSAHLARPGFLARVTFDLATSEDVLLLPVAAVLGAQGAQSVFIIDGGTAARRTVRTGLTSQGRIEIVSGLTEGEQVVVTGNANLREGMSVRVAGTEPQSRGESPPAAASERRETGDPASGTGGTPRTNATGNTTASPPGAAAPQRRQGP